MSTSQSQFCYDNCIVREHSDSDASNESGFSWRKIDSNETSSFSETSEEEDEGPTKDPEAVAEPVGNFDHLKVSVKESFILMLGFLNKVEPYLSENGQLHKESKLLELILINSAANFGYTDQATRRNGEVANTAKTSPTRKSDRFLKQTQQERMSDEVKSSSDVVENSKRRSGRFRNDTNKKTIDKEKPERKTQLRKRKSKSVPPRDCRRVSKRVKHDVGNDRLSIVASKIKQASQTPVKQINSKLATKDKSGQSGGSSSRLGLGVCEKVPKETQKQSISPRKSEKRKLYSSETWMEMLSSTLMP